MYSGWNATTGTTTGPTLIIRGRDWAGSYSETLTTSDAPAVSGSAGSECRQGPRRLPPATSKACHATLMDKSDQVIETDDTSQWRASTAYSATSFHLGTAGTNYYPTTYAYDAEGREAQTVEPTGTIQDTVYDGLDRVVGNWVGTNDATTAAACSTASMPPRATT